MAKASVAIGLRFSVYKSSLVMLTLLVPGPPLVRSKDLDATHQKHGQLVALAATPDLLNLSAFEQDSLDDL